MDRRENLIPLPTLWVIARDAGLLFGLATRALRCSNVTRVKNSAQSSHLPNWLLATRRVGTVKLLLYSPAASGIGIAL